MRPKIVILTLVGAFAVLGLVAVLKGVGGKINSTGQSVAPVVQAVSDPNGASPTNPVASSAGAGKTVAVSEALRAAVMEKELDQIRELVGQADETNNPAIIAALLEKMSSPEIEIRQAVRDALKQLNDTNALPGLEKVAETIKDPREKVAVLDLIDYIQTPSVTQNIPPEEVSNLMAAANASVNPTNRSGNTNIVYNPNFLKGAKLDRAKRRGQPVAAPDAPANQPQ
jgi:hypothetical protein